MANPDSKDAFGIGNLINQFKDRARDVVRQANAGLEPVREPLRALNRQTQKVADAAAHQVRQAQHYIQEKQDQVHQNQRELGGKLQKSYQEFQAQWQRKDAPQAIRDSDGINLFKPVFDAAKATYQATPVHAVQEMVEDGRKAVEKKTGDAIGEGLKQANQSFRQGLKDAAPTLQALDRNIGQFDRDVHQTLPAAPRLADVSHAIDEKRQRDRQAVHEFLMRKDVPAEWGQGLQSASRFMTAKGEHAKYYSDATGLTTTAGYVQDIDLLHSVGKGGFKMAEMVQKPESREALRTLLTRIPQDRALWDARKAEELKEFQSLRQPHAAPVPLPPETIAKRIEETDRRVAEQAGKPHNLLEPAHAQTTSEAAARDSALNSMRGINPDGGEKNCMACVMATYDRHHGIPTSTFVNPGGLAERGARPIDLSILETHFQSEWQQVHGLNELSSHLGKEGSSGVLWFSQDGKAHVLNVANVDGHVVLMDSQRERLVSPRSLPEIRVQADGSTNFQFMPTPPPRNYQGIPPHGFIETPRHRIAAPDGTERLVTDAEARRIIGEPAGPPRHTLIGADGHPRLATDWEARQAIRDATPHHRVVGADGKVSLATDEEVRRGLQAAPRPHVPDGPALSPQRPEPTTGSAAAYPPSSPHAGPHEPPRPFGMRPQDQEIFAEAARREQRWIVVRETNPEALKYIGQPGFTPKPFECKAKSANVPEHKYAGLVVDPKRHPGAFHDPAAASAEWDKMLAQTKGDSRFAVDRSGRLRFEGKLLHSDYDIYDVIHPERPVNLSPVGMQGGQPVFETRGLPPIRDYVNKQIGSEVIQHAAEAQFKGHSEQRLIVFGPEGQRFVTDGKQAIEDVYKERFPGRYALDQSRSAERDSIVQFPKLRAVEAPPDPLKTPISRDELWRQGVQNQRGFQSSPSGLDDRLRKQPAKIEADPEGVGPRVGKGFETFSAIQVLDKNGQRVEVGSGMFRGGGPESHAEARAIRGLEQNGPAKVEGGRMMVVVDQNPCPNCRQKILEYAQSRGVQEIEVHVPTRESLVNRDRDVSPKTAAVTSFQGHRPPTEFNTEVWSPNGEVVSSAKARDAGELVARARREVEESQEKIHQARALQTAQDDPATRHRHPAPTRQPDSKSEPSLTESSAPRIAGQHSTRQVDAQPQPSHAAPLQPDPKSQPSPTESTTSRTAAEHPARQPDAQRPQAESSALKTTQPSASEASAPRTADQLATRQPDAQRPQAESSAPKTTQPSASEASAPRTPDQQPTRPPDAKSQPSQATREADPKSQPSPTESSAPKTADQLATRQPDAQRPQAESSAPKTTQPSASKASAPRTPDQQPTRPPDAKSEPSPTESSAPKTAEQLATRQPDAQRPQAESSAPKTTQPSASKASAPRTPDQQPTRPPDAKSEPSPTESSAPKTAEQLATRQPDAQRPQAESSAPKTTQPSASEFTAPKTADQQPTRPPDAKSGPSPTESSAPKTADQLATRQPDAQRPLAESPAPKTTQPSASEASAPKIADQQPTRPPDAKSQPSRATREADPKFQPSPTESSAPKTADQLATRQPDAQRPQAESSAPKTTQPSASEASTPRTSDQQRNPPPDAKSQPPQAIREADPKFQPSPTESSAPKTAGQRPTSPDADTTRTTGAQSPKPSRTRELGEAPPSQPETQPHPQAPAKSSHTRDLGEERRQPQGEHPQALTTAKASKTRDLGEDPQHPRLESRPPDIGAKTPKTRDLGEDPKRQSEPAPLNPKEATGDKVADAPRPGERLSSNDRASAADDMKRKSGRDETSGDKHSAGGIKSSSGGSTSGHGEAPVEKRSAVEEMRRKSGRDEGQLPAPTPQAPAKDQRPAKA